MAKIDLTAERLRELLHYEPETGVFTRRVTVRGGGQSRFAGCVPGHLVAFGGRTGYTIIGVDGGEYYAHRLAWLYAHERWPAGVIDHLNGERSDNRLCNLRDVPQRVNAQNQRRSQRSKSDGSPLGATFFKRTGRWAAAIFVDRRHIHLGYHDSAEEAHAAYLRAKRKLHEGCTI